MTRRACFARRGSRRERTEGLDATTRIAGGSIIVGAVVLALKTVGWWVTGSAGLYSDALESVVNVAASLLAFLALRVAVKPADANHTYGHAKAEFFAAVIEGVLIVIAALSILREAFMSWASPHPLAMPWTGLALNILATLLNGAWAVVLLRVGRRARSPALVADGRHLVADVVTSVGVTLGVGLAVVTHLVLLDPVVAAATAGHVLWSGMRMISESVGGLMDAAPAPGIVERIRSLVGTHAAGAIEAHDLRMRHAGRTSFLEFHLVVPGDMSVAEAHRICDRVEAALKSEMEGLVITIHVEPEGKAKHHGVLVL